MSKIKVLIVEDEVLIAETISLYLQEYDYVPVAICISYQEAIEAYHLHEPDIILLDIRLFGDKSGIDLAQYFNSLKNKPPYIFLTSQHDKRILDAAVQTLPYGYITKPFVKETLWTSIKTAYELHKSKHYDVKKIELYDGKSKHLVSFNEIIYLESDHVYTKYILSGDREIFTRYGFQNNLELLDPEIFFQCHRGYIINLNHISSYSKEELIMSNGSSIPVSRSKKDELLFKLNKNS